MSKDQTATGSDSHITELKTFTAQNSKPQLTAAIEIHLQRTVAVISCIAIEEFISCTMSNQCLNSATIVDIESKRVRSRSVSISKGSKWVMPS